MGGKKSVLSSETPMIGALKIQSSNYGLTIPLVWGRARMAGNLIWYGGFQSIAHTTETEQGGKGGGGVVQKDTTYTYSASVIMALGEGPMLGIRSAWRGKERFEGTATSTRISQAVETTTLPSSGTLLYTTSHSANFIANVVVEMLIPNASGAPEWTPGILGYDYTIAAGAYTFRAGLASVDVRVTYTWTQTIAAVSALSQLGLSFATGVPGQAVWGYLTTNFPSQAVNYSGISYLYASNYSLSSNAEFFNHTFEIDGVLQFSNTIPDANPADVVIDFLCNPQTGADFERANIDDVTDYRDCCTAQGIFISPALTEQSSAASFLQMIADGTNAGIVWSNNLLKFVPYCDQAITGNGVTYTPNTTPIFDFSDDDYIANGTDDPIRVTRKSPADCYNSVQVEFLNRDNQYNVEIMSATNDADIAQFGIRAMPVVQMHHICDKNVAKVVAQLILQRALYVRNTYDFTCGWKFIALEPMDLVTLTDEGLGMDHTAVRIISIDEDDESGELRFICEDYPKGSATATLYPSQGGSGFSHNYNVDPGNANTPVIFEAPVELASSNDGLDIYLATGGGADYGGCEIWVSTDNATYKRVGDLAGNSRYGTLTSAMIARSTSGIYAENFGVLLTAGGQLLSGTATDNALYNTLMYVGGEYISYQTATLTGTNAYNLATINRGGYFSGQAAHAIGTPFVRCDNAIAKVSLTRDFVGKTIYVKLLAYNVYGGGRQDLASVSSTSYVISGRFITMPPPDVATFNLTIKADATRSFTWDTLAQPIDVLHGGGYRIKYRATGSGTTWGAMTKLKEGLLTATPYETNAPIAGTYDFAIVAVDSLGNESFAPLFIMGALIGQEPVRYGAAGNMLVNSDWEVPTGSDSEVDDEFPFYKWEFGTTMSGPTTCERNYPTNYWTYCPTVGGAALTNSSNTGSTTLLAGIYQVVAVKVGVTYEFSAYMAALQCDCKLRIDWLNSGGGVISQVFATNNLVNGEGYVGGNTFEHFKRVWLSATAPSGAVTCNFVLLKYPTVGGSSVGFFNRAMMCVLQPGATITNPTPWIASSVDHYHGGGIEPYTVTDVVNATAADTTLARPHTGSPTELCTINYTSVQDSVAIVTATFNAVYATDTATGTATVDPRAFIIVNHNAGFAVAFQSVSPVDFVNLGDSRIVITYRQALLAGVPTAFTVTLIANHTTLAITATQINLRLEVVKK